MKSIELENKPEKKTSIKIIIIGIVCYPSGAKYIGFVEDIGYLMPSGKGEYYTEDGRLQYSGDWSNGERHGHGTIMWNTGEKWEGSFFKNISFLELYL